MFKVVFKAPAKIRWESSDLGLSTLDGVDCDDCFCDYFYEQWMSDTITHGYMRFEYDPVANQLITVTEYKSAKMLTSVELNELADYTQGQWSDRIGENFEQEPMREAYISPYSHDQTVSMEIVELI
jgi:hypothetical protein